MAPLNGEEQYCSSQQWTHDAEDRCRGNPNRRAEPEYFDEYVELKGGKVKKGVAENRSVDRIGNQDMWSASIGEGQESSLHVELSTGLADVPKEFICPLSQKLMTDPVIIATGITYDRSAILGWFQGNETLTCPKTGQPLEHPTICPNVALKGIIETWVAGGKWRATGQQQPWRSASLSKSGRESRESPILAKGQEGSLSERRVVRNTNENGEGEGEMNSSFGRAKLRPKYCETVSSRSKEMEGSGLGRKSPPETQGTPRANTLWDRPPRRPQQAYQGEAQSGPLQAQRKGERAGSAFGGSVLRGGSGSGSEREGKGEEEWGEGKGRKWGDGGGQGGGGKKSPRPMGGVTPSGVKMTRKERDWMLAEQRGIQNCQGQVRASLRAESYLGGQSRSRHQGQQQHLSSPRGEGVGPSSDGSGPSDVSPPPLRSSQRSPSQLSSSQLSPSQLSPSQLSQSSAGLSGDGVRRTATLSGRASKIASSPRSPLGFRVPSPWNTDPNSGGSKGNCDGARPGAEHQFHHYADEGHSIPLGRQPYPYILDSTEPYRPPVRESYQNTQAPHLYAEQHSFPNAPPQGQFPRRGGLNRMSSVPTNWDMGGVQASLSKAPSQQRKGVETGRAAKGMVSPLRQGGGLGAKEGGLGTSRAPSGARGPLGERARALLQGESGASSRGAVGMPGESHQQQQGPVGGLQGQPGGVGSMGEGLRRQGSLPAVGRLSASGKPVALHGPVDGKAAEQQRPVGGGEGMGQGERGGSSSLQNWIEALRYGTKDQRRAAVKEITNLVKASAEGREGVVPPDAIQPLLDCLALEDEQLVEQAMMALMTLALNHRCCPAIVSAGGIPLAVQVLTGGTQRAKGHAAAMLFAASKEERNKLSVRSAGAIPPLIALLNEGTLRCRKDAALALYTLSTSARCARDIIKGGAVGQLMRLLEDSSTDAGLEEKVVALVANLCRFAEGCQAVASFGNGITRMVDLLDEGAKLRVKEDAAAVLLQMSLSRHVSYGELLEEGVLPSLVLIAASSTSTSEAKTLLETLRKESAQRTQGKER